MFSVHCTPRVSRWHGKTHGCQHGKTHGTKSEYDMHGKSHGYIHGKSHGAKKNFLNVGGRQHQTT